MYGRAPIVAISSLSNVPGDVASRSGHVLLDIIGRDIMIHRTFRSILLVVAALPMTSLTARAELDLLWNEMSDSAPPPATEGGGITRDDFGECAVLVDFDDLAGGGNTCDGDHVTTQYPGLTFSVPLGNCVVCANSFLAAAIPNNSDPNVAFSQQNTNVCSENNDHSLVEFDPPVTRVGADFFVSLSGDFRIQAYDSDGGLLDDVSSFGTVNGPFRSGFLGVDAGSNIIASIRMSSRGADPTEPFNFSVDDFIYEESCATPTKTVSWGTVKGIYR
jgi:hypothetical protein